MSRIKISYALAAMCAILQPILEVARGMVRHQMEDSGREMGPVGMEVKVQQVVGSGCGSGQ